MWVFRTHDQPVPMAHHAVLNQDVGGRRFHTQRVVTVRNVDPYRTLSPLKKRFLVFVPSLSWQMFVLE